MHWVIGDIHGMFAPLQALLRAIGQADPSPEFVFAGDYVNRGPQSREVISMLLTLDNARFLRGNHDDVFDLVLNGVSYAPHPDARDPRVAFKWFMEHGLDKTLMSYGVSAEAIHSLARHPSIDGIERMTEAVPQSHREFIRSLAPAVEHDDWFVVHAHWDIHSETKSPGIIERLIDEPALRHQTIWGRFSDEDIPRPKAWGRTGFFGHTPVVNYKVSIKAKKNEPLTGPQCVLLDTAAALGAYGRLTGWCVDTRKFIQADTKGNLVGENPNDETRMTSQ
jgi:hypothetical protein